MNNKVIETNQKVSVNRYKLYGLPSFDIYLSLKRKNILKLEWKLKNKDVVKTKGKSFKTIREELRDLEQKILSFSSQNKYRILHKIALIKQLILSLE